VDDDLYEWIGRSHLLLTTRSNVAIEAVLLGTPAASYNPWSPDLWTPPYVKHGPVPGFKDPDEFISFLTGIDCDTERKRQESMLNDLYWVRGNSIEDITARIQTKITD
jgi:predicted glycosyltransferase